MTRDRIHLAFMGIGHFYDHLFLLIFATVAALALGREWQMGYAELIPYATPCFIAFGLGAIPAGWIADKWSREGMMVIFFIGIGSSAIAAGLAQTPIQIGIALLAIGLFASIYHPVGIAMVVHGREKTGMPVAVNGVFGNMGVACATLLTGFLIDGPGWRLAFALPGAVSVATGLAYAVVVYAGRAAALEEQRSGAADRKAATGTITLERATLVRVFAIIFFSTAVGGLIFQSTTFALPKVFEERLPELADTATLVGRYAFIVFAVAACAQLVVGYLVDRHSIRAIFASVAALQAVCFAMMQHLTGPEALIVAVAFQLAVFGQIPINDVLVGRITRSEWRSRVYAFRYIVTFSVVASSVPFIAWLYAYWDFATLFRVLAIAAAAVFIVVLLLPGTGAVTGRMPKTVVAD